MCEGGRYAGEPMAGVVLHINREVMHDGGEIGLLRDLYRATGATSRNSRLTRVTVTSSGGANHRARIMSRRG